MSTPGPHVFGDGRIGLQIISPANIAHRLPHIKSFNGGMITDLFLPLDTTPAHVQQVRDAGLFVSLVAASNGQPVGTYINQTLSVFDALGVGALELNIEEPDPVLRSYIEQAVSRLRAKKRNLRVRINIAPYKGFALPYEALRDDTNLYVCEQNYYGDMSPVAGDEVWRDLVDHGVPGHKASVCYGARGLFVRRDGGVEACALGSLFHQGQLVGRKLQRGIIFSDDLMSEVGLLP